MAIINGTAATDVLGGTAPADQINGLGGDDSLTGAGGNDTLYGGGGGDWLDGGGGNDSLVGGAWDDRFVGGPGNDTFDGTSNKADYDWIGYDEERGTLGVVVNLATGTATDSYGNTDTLKDIEEVSGTKFADQLTGGNPANNDYEYFYGGRGNDTIDGGSGFDEVNYEFDAHRDGNMGIVLDWRAGTVRDGFGDTDHVSHVEMVTATAFSDYLSGNGANNRFDPLWGSDVVKGGNGIDMVSYRNDVSIAQDNAFSAHGIIADLSTGLVYDVRGDNDTVSGIENVWGSALEDEIRGDSGNNLLDGFREDDVLAGRGGNDTVYGAEGHDKLYGGSGNDVVVGSLGEDVMTGGLGNDTFYVELVSDRDIIRDHQKGIDRIDLTEFNFFSGSSVLSLAIQQGPNVVIELSEDTTIEFAGKQISAISAADFIV